MCKYVVFNLLLLSTIVGVFCERHLPAGFPRCSRDDPHMGECILKATETVRPLIIPGVPVLDIPPVEPFIIKRIALEQGTSSMNLKAYLTDVKMYGLSKYKFKKFESNFKELYYLCELTVPGLQLYGNYKVDGKVLVIPIQGNGKFNASISRLDVHFYQKGKRISRDGKTFIIPISTNTTIHVKDPKLNLDGLFVNNEAMNQLTTRAINDNINSLYEDLRPVLEKIVSDFFQRTMRVVSEEISEDELYPAMKDSS